MFLGNLLTDLSTFGGYINSSVVIGICIPSSCNQQSMTTFIQTMLNNSNFTAIVQCSNEQNNLSGGAIVVCVILSILALLVCVGTMIDLISSWQTPHLKKLAELSAIRTLRRIFTINKKENDNSFAFIDGIRVLALFWIIFCHSFTFGMSITQNKIDALSWSHNFAFQLISSGVLSVDTLFVLSGFLTAIVFIREVSKEELSRRLMFVYYLHRYIRITPTFILVMFVSIYLTPYFGSGPVYLSQQGFESEQCRSNHYWWTAFLYIGNLVKAENICLSVSTYLFNDMQFHWIAPLALIPFVIGRKTIAYIVGAIFVCISIVTTFSLLLYYPHLTPNMVRNSLELSTNKVSCIKNLSNQKVFFCSRRLVLPTLILFMLLHGVESLPMPLVF